MIRGFTLIECLIYMALLTLMIIGSHACMIAIEAATDRIQAETLLLHEGMLVHERIRDDVRGGARVTKAHEDVLLLTRPEGDTRIERIDGALIYEVSDHMLTLTAPEVSVQSFTASSTDPAMLSVSYELRASRGATTLTRAFIYIFYP